jgi:hypothetical protein
VQQQFPRDNAHSENRTLIGMLPLALSVLVMCA